MLWSVYSEFMILSSQEQKNKDDEVIAEHWKTAMPLLLKYTQKIYVDTLQLGLSSKINYGLSDIKNDKGPFGIYARNFFKRAMDRFKKGTRSDATSETSEFETEFYVGEQSAFFSGFFDAVRANRGL